MTTKDTKIGFALTRISTDAFASFPDLYVEGKKVELSQAYGFAADAGKMGLLVGLEYRFSQKKTVFLSIKVGCYFELKQDAWNSMLDEQHTAIIVPPGLLGHLIMLSIGTVRGILHAKTENTPLNKFILPTINVNELVKEPVMVPFENV
jgi:hypothetical protein